MGIEHVHSARVVCDLCGGFICNIENVTQGQALELPEKQTFQGRRTFTIGSSVKNPGTPDKYEFEAFVKSSSRPTPIYCIQCALRVYSQARDCITEIMKEISRIITDKEEEGEVIGGAPRYLELGDDTTSIPDTNQEPFGMDYDDPPF